MVAQPNYGLSTDEMLGGTIPSDIIIPSEKAIKNYVDNKDFSNLSLGNLNNVGEGKLHALKSYEDEGKYLLDAEGIKNVSTYMHSTFDSSNFTYFVSLINYLTNLTNVLIRFCQK